MFDTKSDYSLNKSDPAAIVFRCADGVHIRLTREDFDSEMEFQKWKDWSDQDYYATEKAEHIFSNHTLSIDGLTEKPIAVQSPEDMLIEVINQQERQKLRHLLIEGLDNCLTQFQRRRLWLYCVEGLTVRQIAEAEGVRHPSIIESLTAAKRKINDYLKKLV